MTLSYKTKIRVDHSLGLIVVLVLKFTAKALSLILRRDHSIPESPRVIAVANLVGLGSIVYSGILCRALKEKFPSTKIIYITSRENEELAKRLHGVEDVLCLEAHSVFSIIKSGLALVFRLWRHRPELYFDLEVYSSFSATLATVSLAKNRYGFYRKNANFKKNLHTHMIFFNTQRHISEMYSQMALCIQAKPRGYVKGVFAPTENGRKESENIAGSLVPDKYELVLVNTNASELLSERRWPSENWIDFLIQAVERWPGYIWLLVGSAGEATYVSGIYEGLCERTKEKVHNVAGKFSLEAFLGLVERCDLMITSDSGPLHIALALGKPTVSLWGPVSPNSYAPREGVHEVIYTQTYCSPCLHQADFPPCEGNNICMKRITVSSVLQGTERILCRGAETLTGSDTAGGVHITCQNLVDFNPVILHGNFEL